MVDQNSLTRFLSLFYSNTFRTRRLHFIVISLVLLTFMLSYLPFKHSIPNSQLHKGIKKRSVDYNLLLQYIHQHNLKSEGWRDKQPGGKYERNILKQKETGEKSILKGDEKGGVGEQSILKQKEKVGKYKQNDKKVEQKGGKNKLIVWYNGERRPWNTSVTWTTTCGKYTCDVSQNPKHIDKADGVIINAFYLKPEQKPPQRSHTNQIWVFYSREPEHNLRYVKWPSIYWKALFNWTMTFRTDSDIPFPYGAIVKRNLPKKNWMEVAKSKNRSAAWFVSHCHTLGRREDYVKHLQDNGAQVDIHGKCGKLKCVNDVECLKKYRFYLSFESLFCGDYVTEKLYKVMEHDVVPVVRGAADYSSLFPAGSLIDAANFKTPKDLAKYLLYLDTNVTAYAEVLKKKSQFRNTHPQPWCEVCRRLHELPSYRKTYPDIDQWLDTKKCYLPTDL